MTQWVVSAYNALSERWLYFGPFRSTGEAETYVRSLPDYFTEIGFFPLCPPEVKFYPAKEVS